MGQKLALEVFVVGRSRLENEGAAALSEVFKVRGLDTLLILIPLADWLIFLPKALGSLVHISMPQNGIALDGIRALASSFSSNPNLQV